jgi:small subunit ribosomal protein S20|tara:strand:+ start:223 stop:489 length:267 start_codon:yes stop_codon:yes gene_type:complete
MPNTKSAIRKVKKVRKQTLLNKYWKRRYKLAIKKMEGILQKKDAKEAKKYFSKFQSELLKSAKKGPIKKQNVSRKISRISKRIKNINS